MNIYTVGLEFTNMKNIKRRKENINYYDIPDNQGFGVEGSYGCRGKRSRA